MSEIEPAAIDPVTLAVVENGLRQVCDEMDLAFVRAAFSPVISEALDRSDGIYHAETGDLIAQGALGLPVFVGTMQFGTRCVIERAKDVRPGDVYIVNDPYLGGTHLMDVRFVKPFFYDGALFAWLANTGHWPDIGGAVPGGFSANASEVEQEGLRLPPVKLFKEGRMDEEILAIILSNIRIADQRIGDIKAQAAALSVGEKRLAALIDLYGKEMVRACIAELRRRAARQMRARIAAIPDGEYEGEAFVDSDGIVDEPLRIAMHVRKQGTELHFDMSGSSPPCLGPMNSVIATTRSSIYLAIKHIFPEVPINAGTFEPLHIVDPEGTFLYAKYPRPVSGCAAEVSQRIAEAVFAALVPALPDRLFAAPAGTSGNFALGGRDPKRDRSYVMYMISGGGYGGSAEGDGLSNGCSTIGISKTTPLEVMEQHYPVLFREYSLREGSGGAGRRRGGFGVTYDVELRRGEARASFVMDHGRTGPQGALGGDAGGVNEVCVYRDGREYVPLHLSKDQDILIRAGDRVRVSTPGGGGYGDPFERDPERVAADLRRGYYTHEQAAALFGVVVDETFAVDEEATRKLRASRKRRSAMAHHSSTGEGTEEARPRTAASLSPGDALLIVDVQRDFCPGGALPVREGDAVVPVLNEWVDAAVNAGCPVYASRDWHPARHVSFADQGGPWPPHCIQDTEGAAMHPGLRLPEAAVIVSKGTRLDKDQYSALDDTGLGDAMRRAGVKRLWVGGLAREVCVRATVLDALKAGFEVFVLDAGTRAISPQGGAAADEEMRAAGARLV